MVERRIFEFGVFPSLRWEGLSNFPHDACRDDLAVVSTKVAPAPLHKLRIDSIAVFAKKEIYSVYLRVDSN